MAFLDDLLSNARWLDQYLGTQTDKNPNLTADEAQRSPKAAQANAQSVADWLRANGLLGAGPQGTSSGLLRPNANGASGVDESGFNLAYPGPTQLPTAAAPTAQQGPIHGGPSYMGNPFGGAVQVPTAGIQPETIDVSAAPKRQLPVQPLPSTMPVGAVNPDQVLPSPAPQGPGVFGRLQAGAQNFTTGGNPIAGLLNAVQGLTTGTRTDPTGIALAQQQITANAVFKHLVTVEKMAPSQAATVAQMLALQPDLMKEYFKPPATAEAAAVRNVYGGQAGGGIQGALDYQAASTRTKTMAQEQAKNAVQFPDIAANADNMISMIDQLKAHPGKDLATGPVLGRAPAIGGAQADFIARHEQVLAEGMGQFIASVRGSNLRITQGEIMQGQKAINRANRLLGTDAYNAALDDVRHWVERIRTNAGTKAGLGPTPTQVQPPAAPPSQADLQAEARRRGLIQ